MSAGTSSERTVRRPVTVERASDREIRVEGGEDNSVTTVTLEDQNGTTLLVMTEVYPSPEALEAGAGAEQATHETFGQLDDLLVCIQV